MIVAIPTIICAASCLALVLAEHRTWRVVRAVTKTLASLSFIAVGMLGITNCEPPLPDWSTFQAIVVAGLVLGAIGDIALLGKSERAFLGGLVAFLLGHLAYVVAIAQLVSPADWPTSAGLLALAPIVGGVLALAWLWRHLGAMRIPVIAYVLVIVAMVVAALAALRVETLPQANRQLLALGAVLFFASDLAVARDKFVAATFANRAWGLPCYYAGQLLIAWSIGYPIG